MKRMDEPVRLLPKHFDEPTCLNSFGLRTLSKGRRISVEIETQTGSSARTMVLCVFGFGQNKGRLVLADTVVGTLFDLETGRCLSSSRMRLL